MYTYTAPLRDIRFVIDEVLAAPAGWAEIPGFAELDGDTAWQVLAEGAKFASGVLAPANSRGDLQGCRWDNGAVITPEGFREAYRAFVAGGWAALPCDPADGGQGLPLLLDAAFSEMTVATNHAWTMYPGLLHGACECLKAHASEELQQAYLKKLVSGEWLATMNLTEPQAGSDLGLVRTRAEMQADGSCRLTGTKIFISGGEHDLTDNIVHLVLCRIAGAPAGSKGLSLVLAPKMLPDGTRNRIRCDGIEKKMGLKGNATCVMNFDNATGWLVGEPNCGLAAMFVMMNSARLHVGLQGLGHLEMAQQNAHAYANERVQGRGAMISTHPAVRRILWRLRALTEGSRVIAYWTAQLLDEAHRHPDPARRHGADRLVALLTPVVKAFLTELGNQGANDALQVWGGYGYVHDYGIEQTVRDSRIAMIYEGTNEIQAIDLLLRKVLGDGGERLAALVAELDAEANCCSADPALADFACALREQTAALRGASQHLRAAQKADAEAPLHVAGDYLRGLGFTLLAWAWARSARAALAAARRTGDRWFDAKLSVARFGLEWLLPEAPLHWKRVQSADTALLPVII